MLSSDYVISNNLYLNNFMKIIEPWDIFYSHVRLSYREYYRSEIVFEGNDLSLLLS